MPRHNLLRIDDLLLRAATVSGLVWGLGSSIGMAMLLGGHVQPMSFAGIALAVASLPVGLTVAGLRLRQRERRAWALHRLVDDHVEIPVADLLRDSDFTAASLARAIRDLNNAGVAFLVWDRQAGVVQDGRLRSQRVQVEDCPSCGAKVSVQLRIGDLASARCPYCHDPLGAERLMEEKAALIDRLDTDPTHRRVKPRRSFSLALFVVLTLVFWPAGVGYALWHWHVEKSFSQ